MTLTGPLGAAVSARLAAWDGERVAERLWARDGTLWSASGQSAADVAGWLGWLDLPKAMVNRLAELDRLVRDVRADRYTQVGVLGMGGSSLAPELLGQLFATGPGGAQLRVLDSTHPDAVRNFREWAESGRTLFCVSSKSGSTIEPNAFHAAMAAHAPALDFVAITDTGSSLAETARAQGFRAIVDGQSDVGGRYSALSAFGLLPAALHGVDVAALLERARAMTDACRARASANPGLRLGAALGEAALAGRDKLTLITSPRLAGLGDWIEQLVAESTGKQGHGIVPVVGEPIGPAAAYGADRLFVIVRMVGEADPAGPLTSDLAAAGHPVLRIELADALEAGAEFVRWEVATAAAGVVLGIDPFDQPNVQESKDATQDLLDAYRRDGVLPSARPLASERGITAFGDARSDKAEIGTVEAAVGSLLASLRTGDYFGVLAFLPADPATAAVLGRLRASVRDRFKVATTAGIGPRYLHSTGQLHKGGPNTGVFLQISADPQRDLPIPGWQESFGTLVAAQSLGDFASLARHGRRALRLHLADPASGLRRLESIISDALTHHGAA